jgi:two-component system response regulator FlrC
MRKDIQQMDSQTPILIVDDQNEPRSALSAALARGGFAVSEVPCAREALERLETQRFSLVITDVRMPGMSGMQLLREIKQRTPQLPVIVMTGFGTVQNAVEAMQNGAADYLLKPFSPDTLVAAARKLVENANGPAGADAQIKPTRSGSAGREMITCDARLVNVLKMALEVAVNATTVLIQGESGTGKELLARYIHRHRGGSQADYVAVNCAALPETLAESELFGHEKGAFTGAVGRKTGKFELAKEGTIVLDEISEMSPALQAKLLRVLQERQIDRVGGCRPIPMTAKVIAISNVDLKQAVADGNFRKDLYYRINVVPLIVPPLRQRPEDIPLLARHFCDRFRRLNRKPGLQISAKAMQRLARYNWPGNVRELENAIERAVLFAQAEEILPEHLFLEADSAGPAGVDDGRIQAGMTVKEMERRLIFTTLKRVNDNRTHAAELLGISIRTLRNKLREYRSSASGPVACSGA